MWDRISEQARSIHPAETLKRVALSPFWVIGAVIGAALATLWAIYRWVAAAIRVGVRDAIGDNLPRWDPTLLAQWALVAAVAAAVVWLR